MILLLFHEFECDKQIDNESDDWLIAGRGHWVGIVIIIIILYSFVDDKFLSKWDYLNA